MSIFSNILGPLVNAVKTVVNVVTGKNQTSSSAMVFPVGQGLTPAQTIQANKVLGIAPSINSVSPQSIQKALTPTKSAGLGSVVNPTITKAASSGGLGGKTYSRGTYSGGTSSSMSTGDQTVLSAGQFGGATSFSYPDFSSPSTSSIPSLPQSNVINAPKVLGISNTKMNLPEPVTTKIPTIAPSIVTPLDQQMKDAENKQKVDFQSYLDNLIAPPDSAEAYRKAQRETDILNKQQTVNDLTGVLNGIVNAGQAKQLSLTGQGRGIPEAIIGGQQAEIGRETAIAALPIQAQLSAAQGNLEMANENLNTLFKIFSDDATNEYNYRKSVNEAIYTFTSGQDKVKVEQLQKLQDRAYAETQAILADGKAYAKMAFENGQSSLGAKIMKLDINSQTYQSDLADLQAQLKDPNIEADRLIKQQQLIKLQNENAGGGTGIISTKILSTTQFKNAQAAQNLKLTLNEAKAAVEKYGNYERINGEGRGILDTLKIRLSSQISTALEQGVVMPGEMENFQKVAGQLNSSFLGVPNVRNSKTLGSINSLITAMDTRIELQKASISNTYKVTDEQLDTLLNITDLSDQEDADIDALIEYSNMALTQEQRDKLKKAGYSDTKINVFEAQRASKDIENQPKEPTFAGKIIRETIRPFANVATNLVKAGAVATGGDENIQPFTGEYLGEVPGIGKLDLTKSPLDPENLDTLKKSTKAGVDIGLLLSGGGATKNIAKTGFKEGVKIATKQGLKEGTIIGGASGASTGLNEGATLKSTLENTAIGAVSGSVLGGTIGAGSAVTAKTLSKGSSLVKNVKTKVGNLKKFKTEEDFALDLVQSKATEKMKQAALAEGRVTEQGIFKAPRIQPSARDKQLAETVQGIVSMKKSPTQNIDALDKTIYSTDKGVLFYITRNKVPFVEKSLKTHLNLGKDELKLVFASDALAEKTYNAVTKEFMQHIKNQDTKGLFIARKSFDNIPAVKKLLDSQGLGENAKKEIVLTVRKKANEYIASLLPEGNPYRATLLQESQMIEVLGNIADKNTGIIGVNKLQALTAKYPVIKWAISGLVGAGGIGVGGAVLGSTD